MPIEYPYQDEQVINSLLDISVIITDKHNTPAIELRRTVSDKEIIKRIITCAYHNKPIILMPKFTNTTLSLSSAVEKGILHYDGRDFFFNF